MWIGNIPLGAEAWWFARKHRQHEQHKISVFVARDSNGIRAWQNAFAFFAPQTRVYVFPSWDCMPYDGLEPNPACIASRLRCLRHVQGGGDSQEPCVVLTQAAALVQRVPPPSFIREQAFSLVAGRRLDEASLRAFLSEQGYQRSDTVRTLGTYAWRGGIIDIYPPDTENPMRLDLLGDTLESIREFDCESQRSLSRREQLTLLGMQEYTLNDVTRRRFRQGYRALASEHAVQEDRLYQSVSEGIHVAGLCHWLPLLHDRLACLLDYLPVDRGLFFQGSEEEVLAPRWRIIREYAQARLDASHDDSPTHARFLAPNALYLMEDEWQAQQSLQGQGDKAFFSALPCPPNQQGEDGGCVDVRTVTQEKTPHLALRDYGALAREAQIPMVLVADSASGAERLARLAQEQDETLVVQRIDNATQLTKGGIHLAVCPLPSGFRAPDMLVVSERDLFGRKVIAQRERTQTDARLTEMSGFTEGTLVVHQEHGIGRYQGLVTVDIDEAEHDCLSVVYDQDDRLLVPVENIACLSRHGQEQGVALDRLGQAGWQARKAKVKKRIQSIAAQLVSIAAARKLAPAPVMDADLADYDAFCARFAFTETREQQQAIDAMIDDLRQGTPMDRLICGDTGFGKTEVALRAAFIAVASGYQVAVLAPTTLLARQHEAVFRQRFQGTPYAVGALSRLTRASSAERLRADAERGEVAILIGTQALLKKSVRFAKLGLVIIDEEQHFGVQQKESFKETYRDVHTLTLTATPIPRTLQMSLSGLRELSLMTTPPIDRLSVHSFVMPFDPLVIKKALLREHERGGRSFYVTARIQDIGRVARFLQDKLPELKVGIAHGRATSGTLEDVMTDFYDGRLDILLSTSIIESGLDIPLANTLVVDRADLFGLAQLYQLRGRVGRSHRSSWAYFTWPQHALNDVAERRLRVLSQLQGVGGGWHIATHDLELRGGGNLLGQEQSGHIKEVGYELYMQMVDEATTALRRKQGQDAPTQKDKQHDIRIHLGVPTLIPPSYVADLSLRLGLYRRLGRLWQEDDIDAFVEEMRDRFGEPPQQCHYLFEVMRIKSLCLRANISELNAGPKGVSCRFRDNHFADVEGLLNWLKEQGDAMQLRSAQGGHKLMHHRDLRQLDTRIAEVTTWVRALAQIAEGKNSEAQSEDDKKTDSAALSVRKNVVMPAR